MKKTKLLTIALVSFLTLGTAGLASAATAGTWTISTTSVPPWGASGMTKKSNLKKTNSNVASFNGDAMPNAFGYNVTLVNNKDVGRSSTVRLKKDKTVHAGDNSGTKGYHYWARVNSMSYEPNSSNVKLHFSADKK